jgi:hypothetical protein
MNKLTPEQKEIKELKDSVKLLQRQLAQAVKAISTLEKQAKRAYHDNHNVARQVNMISDVLRRRDDSRRRMG